ncbi:MULTISPECIES: GerW family sporulation protein [Pontibacillus]|uniref:GerW family sporulation protein n=1 Tax=Pontibacillus chungwhensis TaxID=265426 RepID=A0ABY8UW53_9BACI|nr:MULTISPECIES: GerW family sporulation protein [Pontibacillus]MCD5323866.1 GerW family sporulation protein [Pontibacillus sp. HN14]WIF97227.1 GerW family sporulation protein [Pontibacillus chungwhensis]
MSEHPIQGLMTTAMESLKDMIDVNTIIGDPVETPDGSTLILTVSKVGFGFAAGGSQFKQESGNKNQQQQGNGSGSNGEELPFGGGSGGGVSITPIAFLIVNKTSGVKMIHLDESTHLYERMIDLAPQAVQKIQDILSKNGDKQNGQSSGGRGQNQGQNGGQSQGQGPGQNQGSSDGQNYSW